MNDNNYNQEDKRGPNAIPHASVVAVLMPKTPDSMKIALSNKQNFALAAEEIFNHALSRTVWNYRENYFAVEIFLKEIKNTAMESVASEKGMNRINDLVYGPNGSAMREFLFSLQVQFFSQFAEFHANWEELIGNIANSLTHGHTSISAKSELSLVPEDIKLRVYTQEQMKDLFLANTWLIMFILIALWGKTLTYEELRSIYRRGLTTTSQS